MIESVVEIDWSARWSQEEDGEHEGKTALMYSAEAAKTSCMKLLLERGADPNIADVVRCELMVMPRLERCNAKRSRRAL
eukprot:SAG11_NODE_875_length_6768_cov_2.183686_5_plen_79_part_00